MAYLTLTERKRAKVAAMTAAVEQLATELAAYAREHGGRFVLFGSAARGEMRDSSDVDIMTDFEDRCHDEAWNFAEERAYTLGLTPDLTHKSWSGPRLLDRVGQEGRVLDGSIVLPTRHRHDGGRKRVRDARWADVQDDATAAGRHFRSADRVLRSETLAGWHDLDRIMALLHYMQSAHTSVESALLRILGILDETPPSGADWHAKLIARCAAPLPELRPAILSSELARDAQQTRSFRHLAMHNYDMTFEHEKATRAIAAGLRLADGFLPRLDAFAREIDA